jgi:predicted DsbA family dithiol-disulfide isomerase
MTTPATTPTPVRIDFVSDVSCPWCVIGLKSLEQALSTLQDTGPPKSISSRSN